MKTITKKEALHRKRTATVYNEAPKDSVCECCSKVKELYQDTDYAWCCNKCHWTRKDRQF